MDSIQGHIETIVFHAEETGFTVARLHSEEQKNLVTIIGPMPNARAGQYIKAQGNWQTHPQHGKQFSLQSFETVQPSTTLGIQKYLESGLIQGIGPVYAEKIVARFGETTLDIIQNAPQRLREIPGLGEKRLRQIIASWAEQRSIRDVMIFLQGLHITPTYAQKIYRVYKEQSIEVVKNRPYDLAKEIFGIGFKMADAIALRVGLKKDSLERKVAGLCYFLWDSGTKGHTCLPLALLCKETARMLDVEEAQMEEAISAAKEQRLIVVEENTKDPGFLYVWANTFYRTEQAIAQELFRVKKAPTSLRTLHILKAIAWVENELSLQLADEQKQAVESCLQEKIHIVTGGPGTGKSTIISAIITILAKITSRIVLAAPTGRAAKRLTQITRKKALTIHSLLEPDFALGGFKRGKAVPLKADVLIIDEVSMVDTQLMLSLLYAIPDHTIVLLIGDVDQLPSVGPGAVLQDLIQSGVISTTKLQKIFRQAAGSKIVVNAHKINHGEFPDLGQFAWSDFHFYPKEHTEDILSEVLRLVQKEIPEKKKLHPVWDIQVLSPMKKGPIGTLALNAALQNALNPGKSTLMQGGKQLRMHDKVMQIKNNYQKNVYNGDLGEIIEIATQNSCVKIAFDEGKIVEYDFSELDELQLAYAVSIHKSQGSEFPCVVIPVHTAHYALLWRNLLYTAVTRGKRFVVLVGQKKAVGIAIGNNQAFCRNTGLAMALKTCVPLEDPKLPLHFSN
ncbi:MAG: ATP-dependent RecD-like DNA helicase [Chlamydiota bacterium]